MVVIPIVII